jgi:hypothetical protein
MKVSNTMSDITTTPDTSYSGLTIAEWSTAYRTPEFGTFDLWQRYLTSNNRIAVYVWDEAHAENDRRSTVVAPAPLMAWEVELLERDRVQDVATAWDLAHAEKVSREAAARVATLEAEVNRLRNEQIQGDDYRLREFWERAADLADEAGHCEVYDELATALGGEPRRQSYTVRVTYYMSLELTRAEANDLDLNDYDPADYDSNPDVYIERD